jgi:hypothetical protein
MSHAFRTNIVLPLKLYFPILLIDLLSNQAERKIKRNFTKIEVQYNKAGSAVVQSSQGAIDRMAFVSVV